MLHRLPRGLPEAVVGERRPLVSGLVVQRRVLLLLLRGLPEAIGNNILYRPLLGFPSVLGRPVWSLLLIVPVCVLLLLLLLLLLFLLL